VTTQKATRPKKVRVWKVLLDWGRAEQKWTLQNPASRAETGEASLASVLEKIRQLEPDDQLTTLEANGRSLAQVMLEMTASRVAHDIGKIEQAHELAGRFSGRFERLLAATPREYRTGKKNERTWSDLREMVSRRYAEVVESAPATSSAPDELA
jgi:hypothetical protein